MATKLWLAATSSIEVTVDKDASVEVGLEFPLAVAPSISEQFCPLESASQGEFGEVGLFCHASASGGEAAATDTGGGALVVSQFTLAADTSRGNRPGFSGAAKPDLAETLYLQFAHALRDLGVPTDTGRFGADMAVSLTNDGPVTLWLDTAN